MKLRLFIIIFSSFFISKLHAQDLEIPVIDSLTVSQEDLSIRITWSYKKKSEINGYRIKRRVYGVSGVIDGSFVNIITIPDPNQTSFVDTTSSYSLTQADLRQEAYVVEAYHFDGTNYDYSNLSEEHKTLWLKTIEFNNCKNENKLNWEHYVGWKDSISEYQIYYSTASMIDYKLVAKVSSSTKQFIHSNLNSNETYYYFIRAKHKNNKKTTSSNYNAVYTRQPQPPFYMNADESEVIEKNKVKLSFSISLGSEIEDFRLLRAEKENGSFELLKKVEIKNIPFQLIDSVDTEKQFFYKIIAFNNCELLIKESNITSNIVLNQQLSENEFGLIKLNWTSYKSYEAGLQNYKLMRQIGTNTPEEIVSTTDTLASDAAGSLINDLIANGSFAGNICYYVQAVENEGSSASVKGISTSNVSCIALEPQVFAPNAFNPLSYIDKNNVFKPYISFAKTYKLQIISRWGNVVFETEDINQAWDGRINGELAREGTYIYIVKITAPNDEYFEKVGNITVFY